MFGQTRIWWGILLLTSIYKYTQTSSSAFNFISEWMNIWLTPIVPLALTFSISFTLSPVLSLSAFAWRMRPLYTLPASWFVPHCTHRIWYLVFLCDSSTRLLSSVSFEHFYWKCTFLRIKYWIVLFELEFEFSFSRNEFLLKLMKNTSKNVHNSIKRIYQN